MPGSFKPCLNGLSKRISSHPGMGESQDLEKTVVMLACQQFVKFSGKSCLHHQVCCQRRFIRSAPFEFIQHKRNLVRDRVLRPEGTVVVDGLTMSLSNSLRYR